MKFSESWLREWVNPPLDTEGLVHELTMAGLEVDAVEPVAPALDGIVVGEVTRCDPHPDADKLSVCDVAVGDEILQIVCGAPNVHQGMKAPTALVGAKLPGGMKIRKAKLRGVESRGMLCSEIELGLGEDASGLMALPTDAPVGASLKDYLALDDQIIDVDLTPNRGDCFSVLGIAREAAVLTDQELRWPELVETPPASDETFPIEVRAPDACPRFCGRVVRGIDPTAATPAWLAEKLRRSGLRPISPVVDVTNYVMLELGQPLHGFDLATLEGGIVVRRAEPGERLTLLDGREIELKPDMLVIADHGGPRALAGIMGGASSGVGEDTVDVFFEVAFFDPDAIAGRARRLGLHTDASLRFERGVDPTGQRRAIERATELLIGIAGGVPGPVTEVADEASLPVRAPVALREARIERVLGASISPGEVETILRRLGMKAHGTESGWNVKPPAWRFDIALEEDLIEEIARIHGYDAIRERPETGAVLFGPLTETRVPTERAVSLLVDRGYQEVVTYSFVERGLQAELAPELEPVPLANPISSEMSEMRVSLWPGLVAVCGQNLKRQQNRIRIFEHGLRFFKQKSEIKQVNSIAGLIAGPREPEQWGSPTTPVDFFDLKGDVAALLDLTGDRGSFDFAAGEYPALHPGRCAHIRRGEREVGWLGALHPATATRLDLGVEVYLFEIETDAAFDAQIPAATEISRYPSVRRDLAILVGEGVTWETIEREVRAAAGDLLRDVRLFDVYRGKGVDSGLKSIALGLILQETSRTLTDDDADGVVKAVISRLERKIEAKIRD
jgi:phenylalanyl-tRNA synthetase beta chain